jgi:hypothetical protein
MVTVTYVQFVLAGKNPMQLGQRNGAPHLHAFLPCRVKRQLTELRTASYPLRINIGRHTGVERQDRICEVCASGEVEDLPHFLLSCPAYERVRQRYLHVFPAESSAPAVLGAKDQVALGFAVSNMLSMRKALLKSQGLWVERKTKRPTLRMQ